MAQFKASIQSYSEALSFLDGKDSRKLAHNTYVSRTVTDSGVGRIDVRYHQTDIVSYLSTGAIVLRSGGWETSTTRDRIRKLAPPGIDLIQEKGEWYVADYRPAFLPEGLTGGAIHTVAPKVRRSVRVDFRDGMLILPTSSLHGLDRAGVSAKN